MSYHYCLMVNFLKQTHMYNCRRVQQNNLSDTKAQILAFKVVIKILVDTLGSLSTRVFETRTATGREQFALLDRIASQIFILFISNGEKILRNVNVVV